MVIKLNQAKKNKEYKVVSVLGLNNISVRLKELGFVKNTIVKITHLSIFGGTAIVNIRGYFLCIKKNVLSKVLVSD